jgi:AAA+ ATPase superfamily predicted ATPase
MKPNPGGIITGTAIVDRDHEIDRIWNALEDKSVVLTSERRVGKTSVLRKMLDNPKDNWVPILYWVEGKHHPIEFVEGLYDILLKNGVVEDKLHQLKKLYTKFIGGEQIGSWKLPQIKENWKTLLESTIETLVDTDQKVLLMFDELPLMLSNFIKSQDCGPQIGMEFLDTLREIRNKYEATKNVAFVFCGSIGISLVIKDLKRNHGYNSDPINNMKIITLSGMDDDGARLLCDKLSEGEQYRIDGKDKLFDYLCKNVDNLPFYIQHIFAYISESGKKEIIKEVIDEAIDYLLNDPRDEGFFSHYVDRIKTYYSGQIKELALTLLDKASKKTGYWKENEIIKMLMDDDDLDVDVETIRETLSLLWSDHYFVREIINQERSYQFKYTILKKWWKVNRG